LIVEQFTPHRQSPDLLRGGQGWGENGTAPRLSISQRADFFETEVAGYHVNVSHPIRPMNRMRVARNTGGAWIIGDANMSEYALYLKLGATALVSP